jgi:outer membrane protein assembly factor BamB
LLAFSPDINCQLNLVWQATNDLSGAPIATQDTLFSPPTIANGVAYFGVGWPASTTMPTNYRVYAVAETVGTLPLITPGQVLWQSSNLSNTVVTAPMVANGKLFVTSQDGHVYAYGLPAMPKPGTK